MVATLVINNRQGTIATPVRPGFRYRGAPERQLATQRFASLDRLVIRLGERVSRGWRHRRFDRRIEFIESQCLVLEKQSLKKVAMAYAALRQIVARHGHSEETLIQALAYAALLAERQLGIRARRGQLQAADAMLHGYFVEMATGEGKTLATVLAASVAALDGTPVHVLTTNEYLAQRDARNFASLYAVLGVTVSCSITSMDDHARRLAYTADVVHTTGKQIGFDWLRDLAVQGRQRHSLASRLARLGGKTLKNKSNEQLQEPSQPLLRGLCLAIVDEADSLLIDEARTPLVLAMPREQSAKIKQQGVIALALSRMLCENIDYRVLSEHRQIELTEQGRRTLAQLEPQANEHWPASRYRDERVRQALVAERFWLRDRDYIVVEDTLQLIDANTGRRLPDRRLQDGLHTLLEIKERCKLTPENEAVASIGYQRFFQRYRRLVGTSGTLKEVRAELSRVYGVSVVRVALACASRLSVRVTRIYRTQCEQLEAMMLDVQSSLLSGRPVLIGVRSVQQSKTVSRYLHARLIPHQVLNADQNEEEALIVSRGGYRGSVTVATNMAGRGTDIPLGPGVAACGGLHVVSLAFHDAYRIDRQLSGRTARQGAPGSYRQLWALDDPYLIEHLPAVLRAFAHVMLFGKRGLSLRHSLVGQFIRGAQWRIQRKQAQQRFVALTTHEHVARQISIAGHTDQTL